MTCDYSFWARYLCLMLIVTLTAACNGSVKTNTNFDKLCELYKDIVPQQVDLTTKEIQLIQRVEKEFPRFYKDNFQYIVSANHDQRYDFINQISLEETKKPWNCEIARTYYATEFVNLESARESVNYDRLCEIYREVVPQSIPLHQKELNIIEGVKTEFEHFHYTIFIHIATDQPAKRYDTIDQMSQAERDKPWNCGIARDYYAKEFGDLPGKTDADYKRK